MRLTGAALSPARASHVHESRGSKCGWSQVTQSVTPSTWKSKTSLASPLLSPAVVEFPRGWTPKGLPCQTSPSPSTSPRKGPLTASAAVLRSSASVSGSDELQPRALSVERVKTHEKSKSAGLAPQSPAARGAREHRRGSSLDSGPRNRGLCHRSVSANFFPSKRLVTSYSAALPTLLTEESVRKDEGDKRHEVLPRSRTQKVLDSCAPGATSVPGIRGIGASVSVTPRCQFSRRDTTQEPTLKDEHDARYDVPVTGRRHKSTFGVGGSLPAGPGASPWLTSRCHYVRCDPQLDRVSDSGSKTAPLPQPPSRRSSDRVRAAFSLEPESEPSGHAADADGTWNDELCFPDLEVLLDDAGSRSTRGLQSAVLSSVDGRPQLTVHLEPVELIRWNELHLIDAVSTGSFGEVFLSRFKDQEVAVKRCLLGHSDTDGLTTEQLRNFEREINVYRCLDHPNLVRYFGCVLEHPNLAIVTEYAPNGNVFDLLYTHQVNLPAALRLKIARQVALALCYMHSCDPVIVHRDMKTHNVVLDGNYSAKLCDFGKTQPVEGDNAQLLQEDNGGSPRYMAPECFKDAYITEKVDIWSLACCIVEILGGPLPYEDTPQMSAVLEIMLVQRQSPMVPSWFVPSVRPMLARCFDFDPEARPVVPETQLTLRGLTPEELVRHGMDKRRTH